MSEYPGDTSRHPDAAGNPNLSSRMLNRSSVKAKVVDDQDKLGGVDAKDRDAEALADGVRSGSGITTEVEGQELVTDSSSATALVTPRPPRPIALPSVDDGDTEDDADAEEVYSARGDTSESEGSVLEFNYLYKGKVSAPVSGGKGSKPRPK